MAATTLLDVALRYAELGYLVFPCKPKQKTPLTPHGFRDATRDEAQIRTWWTRWPDANIAIVTQEILVIDIDPQGRSWPNDPERAATLTTAGAISITPRGGRHYLFAKPLGVTWRCSAGKLAPGVDVRTDGGYILVPPSTTVDGQYRWVPGHELEYPPNQLPNPPDWLAAELARVNGHSVVNITSDGQEILAGQRNTALTRLAGLMRRGGMMQTEILAALREVNTNRCRPPLDEEEVRRIASSVARYEPNQATELFIYGVDTSTPRGVQFSAISSAELATTEYTLEYLVEGVLVRGQPGIIAGPRKTLKTSIAIDLALSLAEGGLFLGRFNVPQPVRVGLMSGESGAATIQETARRIASAKGRPLTNYENCVWSFDIPQLGHLEHIDALERFITDYQLAVLILDPIYLMMPSVGEDAGNLFVTGRLLRSLGELTQRTGCTLVICHHMRKTRLSPYEPPELDDIAWAGFQEFTRQWILINRRRQYDPTAPGYHQLWLNVGGSAGHCGLWAVTIEEGAQDDPGGRRWDVTVMTAHTAYTEAQAENEQRKYAEQQQRTQRDCESILKALQLFPQGETARAIREMLGISGQRFTMLIQQLIADGIVEPCIVTKQTGRLYGGYRLVQAQVEEEDS